MDVIEAIYHRRSVRHYTNQPVSAAVVNQLFDAAVQAPSSLNQQPWAFAFLGGKERLLAYSKRAKEHFFFTTLPPFGAHERGESMSDPEFNIFYDAGAALVICAVYGGLNPAEDCCLAAENIMLAAHGLGLGTAPIGVARPWMNLPEVKEELGIPPDCSVVMVLTVGYPSTITEAPARKPPDVFSWLAEAPPAEKLDGTLLS